MRSAWIVALLPLLLAAGPAGAGEPPDAFAQAERMGRGVNILGYDPIWDRFEKARFKEKHFRVIRQGGFQTVRINLHGLQHVDGDRLEPAWLETLDWAVDNALAAGLMVVLDLHNFTDFAKDPAGLKPKFLTFWREVSRRFRDAPSELIFEILNEPNGLLTPALWNAYLAEAYLTLFDVTGDARWLERARRLADAMLARFWDAESGGFYMSAEGADPHLIARPKSPSDGAIPSGNSVAVRALSMLAARGGERVYGDRASATLSAFGQSIRRHPSGFAYMLMAADELLHGGAGPRQYAAAGNVRATAREVRESDGEALTIAVDLAIRDGWHVNSDRPLSDDLIATHLGLEEGAGWRLEGVEYPPADTVRLGFQDEPLSVFQGEVTLTARVAPASEADPGAVAALRLKIQACDDRVCLKPEELVLEVPITQ